MSETRSPVCEVEAAGPERWPAGCSSCSSAFSSASHFFRDTRQAPATDERKTTKKKKTDQLSIEIISALLDAVAVALALATAIPIPKR